jgi:CMP-N,N'-diacetyllegionaminic acid synthase
VSDILGLINARGGSKSIPHKNLAPLAGKPLIAWTIEAALKSRSLARIVVSTDDHEIAETARACGATVPFMRPAELAKDDTPGIMPVLHAVQWLAENENYCPEYVMLLQPTSPLRTTEDIEAAIQLARERGAEAVVSVTDAQTHPYWMKRVTEDGLLADFLSLKKDFFRRQDLPRALSLNGAIFLVRRDSLLQGKTLHPARTYPYFLPAERALDVDEPWDLYLADLVLRDRMRHENR